MTTRLFGFWRSLATFRVRIALNLKGIAFDEVAIDLLKGEQFSESYRAVNPQMVLPALVVGEAPALTQSLAIIDYLDETHSQPPLLPVAPRDRHYVRMLAQIVACDAHPLIVPRIRNYLADELKLDEAARLKWIRHWSSRALEAIETQLIVHAGAGKFCHGNAPTLADICLVSHVEGARLFQFDLTAYPTAVRIADECLKIDAFALAHPLRQPGAPQQAH
jgi:maleylacetoacetate isomerase